VAVTNGGRIVEELEGERLRRGDAEAAYTREPIAPSDG
jgi:hypothetical protein